MQAMRDHNDAKAKLAIAKGALAGAGARFFWHFVAGWAFWGAYALWGMKPWLFSLVMNGASGLASAAVALIVLLIMYSMAPSIFRASLHRTSKV